MKNHKTVADIINSAGGNTKLGLILKIGTDAIKKWKLRKKIPRGYWDELIALDLCTQKELEYIQNLYLKNFHNIK